MVRKISQKKANYVNQLRNLSEEYSKILVVNADNVGSLQFQQIRKALRGTAVIVMGKNTMMKKAINLHKEKNPKLQALIPLIKNNVGLVFTNEDLTKVRDVIVSNKVAAPARQGAISPIDVIVPANNTGLEPTKTSFFQALNIPTKITKGTVEIIADYHLIKKGDKVGNSEATLLQMLNIKPFFYGLTVNKVYDDGNLYEPSVLDINDQVLSEKFYKAVNNVASISLALGIPTEASLPHTLINGFKSLLALAAAEEGITFKEAEEVKAYLKDPSKFAVASSSAPAPAAASSSAPAKVVEEKKEEEEDLDMGSLFG